MKQHLGLSLGHTDNCEVCEKSRELRLVTLVTDAIQILFAAVAIVVLTVALYLLFFGGGV